MINPQKYFLMRGLVATFVGLTVALAVNFHNFFLALLATVIGGLFLLLVRTKTNLVVDEREELIRCQAAQVTYQIFLPTLGLGSVLLIFFARDEYYFLQSLGLVLAYLTLFGLGIYALAHGFFSRQLGGK